MSTPGPQLGCIGYGPAHSNVNPAGFGIGTALDASEVVPRIPGVYREVPVRGIVFWDFHGFNLTAEDTIAHGRINLTYARSPKEQERRLLVNGALNGENQVPPFRHQRLCNEWTVPKGAKVLRITSHTHRHASNFRIWNPSGEMFYESKDWESAPYIALPTPFISNAEDPRERTFKFCADFNNGLNEDGTPNMDLLVQASLVPEYELFRPDPVACAAGRVAEPCVAALGDAQCDSQPGAADGKCDAAPIGFGQTSEMEMFMMAVDVIMPESWEPSGTLFDSTYWGTPLPNVDLQ